MMELINKIKHVIENTDLFIEVRGHYPNVVSDFGRVKFIDLEKKTVKFSRYEVTKRQLGGEMAWGQDIFLRTEIEIEKSSFEIVRNWCKQDGSWQRWKMDELKSTSWDDLYSHVRNIEINKNMFTKLKHFISEKKKQLKFN